MVTKKEKYVFFLGLTENNERIVELIMFFKLVWRFLSRYDILCNKNINEQGKIKMKV
jgi:hypothetical protein